MSKEKMKVAADSIFGRYPKTDKVFITSDGQAFLDEVVAKNHAANNRTGKELAVEAFLRPERKAVQKAPAVGAPASVKAVPEKGKPKKSASAGKPAASDKPDSKTSGSKAAAPAQGEGAKPKDDVQ